MLADQSTEQGTRERRAKGLVAMGRIFKSYGSSSASGFKKTDFLRHVEEVGRRAEQLATEAREKQDAQ